MLIVLKLISFDASSSNFRIQLRSLENKIVTQTALGAARGQEPRSCSKSLVASRRDSSRHQREATHRTLTSVLEHESLWGPFRPCVVETVDRLSGASKELSDSAVASSAQVRIDRSKSRPETCRAANSHIYAGTHRCSSHMFDQAQAVSVQGFGAFWTRTHFDSSTYGISITNFYSKTGFSVDRAISMINRRSPPLIALLVSVWQPKPLFI